MKIIYGINGIRKFKRPVVALGVFDGVHLGHRYILRETIKQARAIKGTSIVITFYPHPQGKESLYSLEDRLRLIAELGIDVCAVIKFNRIFSRMSAEDFIKNILVKRVGANFIYIGRNFRFGRGARGNWQLLQRLSSGHNYKVRIFPVIKVNGQPVSSTYIRSLITGGRLAAAQKLLQRPVTVLGSVVKGISLARRLGFPTANIDPHHEILPACGVYAVKVVLNKKTFCGVCNIGRRPTVLKRNSQKHVEVYIFGFQKNIYGKELEIQFIQKIRDEKKFTSLARLARQIKKDILRSKKILS